MPPRATVRARLALALAVLVALAASAGVRWRLDDRTPGPTPATWTVSDPDSLYHARRVERALAEPGLPAAHDARLNHPEGARIPWPPYYDALLAGALGPFLPPEDRPAERRGAIERGVGSAPFLVGVLTTLVVLLAGRALAGTGAGLAAATLHALCLASVAYSRLGNGDHHAFHALLSALVLTLLSAALRGERLARARWSLGGGALLGVLLGLAMGAWVGALLLMVLVDAVLGLLLLAHARRALPGLPAFGLTLHAAALATLLPAILQSPWKEELPWLVVNLSWFHAAYLGAGVLVFAPPALLPGTDRLRRLHPALVVAALALVTAVSALLDAGPVPGLREGFAWVTRENTFMSGIAESRPLLGPGAAPGELFELLGHGIVLLPLAWLAMLLRLRRGGARELLPWVVAVPPMALQAAQQARFADALAAPAAVTLAWAGGALARRLLPGRGPAVRALPLVALAALAQLSALGHLAETDPARAPEERRDRARRGLCEWIAEHAPGTGEAVLANWSLGHELEWAAQRPTVATNFGSYVGRRGFLAPARVLLARDPAQAETLLAEFDARLVLVTAFLPGALDGWLRAGPAEWRERYLGEDAQGRPALRRAWYESLGGRLVHGGHPRVPAGEPRADSVDFLRLLHASPTVVRRSPISPWAGPTPYGWVWERVAGATVVLEAEPGAACSLEVELEYPGPDGAPLERVRYLRRGEANDAGRCRLRLPYATTGPNGDGRVRSARWRAGAREGELRVSEEAVREGRYLLVGR